MGDEYAGPEDAPLRSNDLGPRTDALGTMPLPPDTSGGGMTADTARRNEAKARQRSVCTGPQSATVAHDDGSVSMYSNGVGRVRQPTHDPPSQVRLLSRTEEEQSSSLPEPRPGWGGRDVLRRFRWSALLERHVDPRVRHELGRPRIAARTIRPSGRTSPRCWTGWRGSASQRPSAMRVTRISGARDR